LAARLSVASSFFRECVNYDGSWQYFDDFITTEISPYLGSLNTRVSNFKLDNICIKLFTSPSQAYTQSCTPLCRFVCQKNSLLGFVSAFNRNKIKMEQRFRVTHQSSAVGFIALLMLLSATVL